MASTFGAEFAHGQREGGGVVGFSAEVCAVGTNDKAAAATGLVMNFRAREADPPRFGTGEDKVIQSEFSGLQSLRGVEFLDQSIAVSDGDFRAKNFALPESEEARILGGEFRAEVVAQANEGLRMVVGARCGDLGLKFDLAVCPVAALVNRLWQAGAV